jgi:beta-1,4-N-acetylglucosaminyltransferase
MQSAQKGLRRRRSSAANFEAVERAAPLAPEPGAPRASVLVVFGSGGHTAEMLALLAALPAERYGPFTFVAAASDSTSEPRAKAAALACVPPGAVFERIVRSREVGQSFLTAALTTLAALLGALRVVFAARPALVLVNGPGTCLPVCLAAALLALLQRLAALLRLRRGRARPCRVVFVESACRVESLSLTARILYSTRLADAVLVQWRGLLARFPRAQFVGLLS